MRKYSSPAMQAISEQAHANVQSAAHIMTAMQKTLSMSRRESDKRPVEPTAQQQATIAKNQGVHIYGMSHPLYKESK